jgi:hypothetical protein
VVFAIVIGMIILVIKSEIAEIITRVSSLEIKFRALMDSHTNTEQVSKYDKYRNKDGLLGRKNENGLKM